ncbi:c-type cytochrome [Desertivirga arenae]|uniref:c-type cytochrome n=1 Tax=Desertivirga arenae TaxID=2810309 RepID=UPI001A9640D7|nr:cytochrome c [Pedobacter sp. SYSU D00823]
MRKVYIFLFIGASFLLQLCTTKKKAQNATVATKVTYVTDIQPLVVKHCSPCHIPPQGKKEPLNTYAAMKAEIDNVIESIKKNPGEHGFMPARRAKLSDSTILVFENWKKGGLLEQ